MAYILLLIGGLILGSFINMIVWRIPQNISLKGRSLCVQCLHPLAWFDLFPLVSFAVLKAHCRYCKKKISWRYPFTEFATVGALIYAYFVRPELFGSPMSAIFIIFIIAVFITLFIIDYEFQIIPDSITLPAIGAVLVIRVLEGGLLSSVLAALAAGGFFAVQYAFSKGRWIGDGDIRLGILIGLALGWPVVLAALIIAYFAGALIGLALIGLKRARFSSKTPFAVYLTCTAYVAILYGKQLVDWYLRLW